MKDKIGRVFPILLVIAIIIKAVLLFTNNTDTDTTSLLLLTGFEELVIYAAIPTIIFYMLLRDLAELCFISLLKTWQSILQTLQT